MNSLTQVSSQVVLLPAYGKKYACDADMLADWQAGKDFKVFFGHYCSIRDINSLHNGASRVLLTQDHFNYIEL